MSLSRFSLALATVCLLGQCNKSTPTASGGAGEEALAMVAGHPITAKDLRAEAEWRQANRQAIPAADVLLQEMVDRLSLVERARQSGLEDEPDTRRRIESLLIARLREKDLDQQLAKLEVSDDEVAAAYESRKEEFNRQGLDRFAVLFLAADSKKSDEARAETRKRLESALDLSDANPATGGRGPAASGFGALAVEYSDDQASRYRGGDIGWVATDADTRFPSALIEAGRGLAKGARSAVIEGEDGFYAIMKTDTRPGGVQPLAEVSGKLRQSLLLDKRRALETAFVGEAHDQAKVEMNAEAALKIDLPVSRPPAAPDESLPRFPESSRPASAAR
ncbi:peptidylprolyl isomerase [Luteolibacter marinus]|uniref:peptidylprolyl isomerase n=1 Tax=Luteolibacter marinus TaxID=2776705 RepID=UPI0018692DCF|nr:peptidyl-prolyl cis-trans isomerase [Luteolibacter marinus]